ncbi:ribbon-helix-helix domain-containing protein [Ruegeria atlantica]|uniref:ribbon-helix-helix domain-containing protein n=1 Tax=Ruegeria atlantica TaxID=81569 RepID=UPI003D7C75BF
MAGRPRRIDPDGGDLKRIVSWLPESDWQELQDYHKKTGISVAELVRRSVQKMLSEIKDKGIE